VNDSPYRAFSKVLAAVITVGVSLATLVLTTLLGADWAALLAPIHDLEPLEVPGLGLELDYGPAIATALAAGIVGGLAAAAAWLKREFRGYGFGIPKVPVVPAVIVGGTGATPEDLGDGDSNVGPDGRPLIGG